tara:strand:- start:6312 stop:6650 length:339 start_codon:yes stop_codon:yes gene_type:complete
MNLAWIVEPSPQPEIEKIFLTEGIIEEKEMNISLSIISIEYINDVVIHGLKSVSHCDYLMNIKTNDIFTNYVDISYGLIFFLFLSSVMCSIRYYNSTPKTYIVEENIKSMNV